MMPWFKDFMQGCDLSDSPDFGRMLHQPDGSGQFTLLNVVCWFTAGTKKEALSRLF